MATRPASGAKVRVAHRHAHFAPEAGRDTIETLGRMLNLGRDGDGEGPIREEVCHYVAQ